MSTKPREVLLRYFEQRRAVFGAKAEHPSRTFERMRMIPTPPGGEDDFREALGRSDSLEPVYDNPLDEWEPLPYCPRCRYNQIWSAVVASVSVVAVIVAVVVIAWRQ